MDYDAILAALPRLSQKQLRDLRSRCGFLLQRPGAPATPMPDEDWLFLGILSELKRRNFYTPTDPKFRGRSHAAFTTTSAEVRRLLELAAPGLDAVEKRALGQVAAAALMDYLKLPKTPTKPYADVTFQNMMMHVSLVPNAIDHAYPGYMQAQMLAITVRDSHGSR